MIIGILDRGFDMKNHCNLKVKTPQNVKCLPDRDIPFHEYSCM